jgi:oxygen-independent coproporphyrinogen-3 oxidase
MAEAGLVQIETGAIQVTAAGWFLVRAIAMVFDQHLQQALERQRYSRVV